MGKVPADATFGDGGEATCYNKGVDWFDTHAPSKAKFARQVAEMEKNAILTGDRGLCEAP